VLYFATPSSAAARTAMTAGPLGMIVTPAQGNRIPSQAFTAIDNGCGPGENGQPGTGYPGDEAYLGLLTELRDELMPEFCDPDTYRVAFATAPDVLGDAAATLARAGWSGMLGWIRDAGYPAALVAQNGIEHLDVPWGDFDALFLGGSPECLPCGYVRPAVDDQDRCPGCRRRLTEWKLGRAARGLAAEANARGKWVHMGRVNSRQRFRYAAAIGCRSADGTYLKHGPDQNLPKLLAWVDSLGDGQGSLWEWPPRASQGPPGLGGAA
jgi:hypothetical protein